MTKICHLTSVHPRYDTRIFLKECISLAQKGYDVSLIVADGQGDEKKKGVEILDCGGSEGFGRLKRMTFTVKQVYFKALAVDAEIYHLHDPELLRVGLKLIKLGKKVIYDVHEDVPRQILSKHWIPSILRQPLAFCFERYENFVAQRLSLIICATPFIRDRFAKINPNSTNINNFPIIKEFQSKIEWSSRQDEVCYVGGIAKVRGICELIDSLSLSNTTLNLAGRMNSSSLEEEIKSHINWQRVNFHGYVDRQQVSTLLANSKIGIVTLHPVANYLDSLPIKMFEYMAAGLPVIASDFPYWRKILKDYDCALFVDPLDKNAIASATKSLLSNDQMAEDMGTRAQQAVKENFSWDAEEKTLVDSYTDLVEADV